MLAFIRWHTTLRTLQRAACDSALLWAVGKRMVTRRERQQLRRWRQFERGYRYMYSPPLIAGPDEYDDGPDQVVHEGTDG